MDNNSKETPSKRFPKSERLHHRSLVERLFRSGRSFYEFPFRVNWNLLSEEELSKNFRNIVPPGIGRVQVMVTVPKKKRKRAVDRVLMRRRIKEAYRLNKSEIIASLSSCPDLGTLSIALVYIHDKNLDYTMVEGKVKSLLEKLQRKLLKEETQDV